MNPTLMYAGTPVCVRTSLHMQDKLAKFYKKIFYENWCKANPTFLGKRPVVRPIFTLPTMVQNLTLCPPKITSICLL